MNLNPCKACGGEVHLRAFRITANRRRGVSHYIEHMTGTNCDSVKGLSCSMVKPYPRSGEQPCDHMIVRWNEQNPARTA